MNKHKDKQFRMIGLKDKMQFSLLMMIVVFCQCNVEQKKGAEITRVNSRLLQLQSNLLAIGETSPGDTNQYSNSFLLLRPIGYGTGKELILSIKKIKNDTLCFLSYTKIEYNYPNYFTQIGLERAKYLYPYSLSKTTKFINKDIASEIFRMIDTLIDQKTISPFDRSLNKSNKGDVNDGGTFLLYSNVYGVFECPSTVYNNLKMKTLDSFVFHSIDIENLNREVGYATEP